MWAIASPAQLLFSALFPRAVRLCLREWAWPGLVPWVQFTTPWVSIAFGETACRPHKMCLMTKGLTPSFQSLSLQLHSAQKWMPIYNVQISVPLKFSKLAKMSPPLGDCIPSHWLLNFRAQGRFEFSKVMSASPLRPLGSGLLLSV